MFFYEEWKNLIIEDAHYLPFKNEAFKKYILSTA